MPFAPRLATALLLSLPATLPATLPGLAQTVLSGDHVIQGDLCAGWSCSATESFDTTVSLKIKASLLDVEFDDASTDTFPDRDWRLNRPGFTGVGLVQ